jgi:cytochrome P450
MAIAAAQAGNAKQLETLILEAWRFNPTFPVVTRYCPNGARIAAGTERELDVPAGATVNAVLLSAMFDANAVDRPERFGAERSAGTWLQFGDGPHQCLGQREAITVLVALTSHLLRLPDFAIQKRGRIRYDGPAVDRYELWLR